MSPPLIVYSCITKLAYNLGQNFYGGVHYVWCAPRPAPDRFGWRNPDSSDPLAIYRHVLKAIQDGDGHSPLIEQNRRGLLFGAQTKEQQGVINAATRQRIEAVVKLAPLSDFSPLLLVMPYAAVCDIIRQADLEHTARPTSEEYIIEALPRNSFDVLELHG